MLKWSRYVAFSIISSLAGLYLPVFVVAIVAGDTNYEKVLPYCLISSAIFLVGYIALEINITKGSSGR